jgi:putative toxin-antitoxin system antitoxin component (TIGR02293 family)
MEGLAFNIDIFLLTLGKMSIMSSITDNGKMANAPTPAIAITLKSYLSQGASINALVWAILGGKQFMAAAPETALDYITATNKGIPKQAVHNLAEVIDVPMKDMATLLNISYKTLGRKKKTDTLDSLSSSLSIELANTVAKGLAVFEDRDKFSRWLQKENRALQGKKPFELLNTPTGIKMINKLLGKIEEGVYT